MMQKNIKQRVVLQNVTMKVYDTKTETLSEITALVPYDVLKPFPSTRTKQAMLAIQEYMGTEQIVIEVIRLDEPMRYTCTMNAREFIEASEKQITGAYYKTMDEVR